MSDSEEVAVPEKKGRGRPAVDKVNKASMLTKKQLKY